MGNLCHKQGETYKILNKDLLAECRTLTGFTDADIIQEHEKFFKVTGNGCLKKSHMEELLGDYIPSVKHKHLKYMTDCIFSAIDTKNDGYIDFLEYLISIKFFQTESPIEKATFVFKIIDKNGDHIVTVTEMERILKCLEDYHKTSSSTCVLNVMSNGSKPAAATVIEKLDEDGSGSIATSEFVDGWLKSETIRALFDF